MGPIEKIKNKKGTVHAVIYARYSSDNQRDESIDAQLRLCREYAQKDNIIIVGEYVDRARSARTDNRPEFLRMIDDSSKKNFDLVIVHKLDRFSRSRNDSIGYRMQLKRHGVTLISVSEPMDGSPESLILESILEAMAEYYSLNLSREVRKGMHENALKGIHTGGKPPLGYNVDPNTRLLTINEDEAKIVKLIFQRYLEGVGYNKIINELNSLGYKSKVGNKFTKTSLNAILTNEKYSGVYVFNRTMTWTPDGKRTNDQKDESEIIKIDGLVPTLVSKEDFKKVAELIESRKHVLRGQHNTEVYLLTGKIYCGVCGNTYVGCCNRDGRHKTLQVRYGCNRRHRGTKAACDNKEIRREYIEAFVLEELSEQIFDDSLVPIITRHYNQRIEEANEIDETRLKTLKKKEKELERKIENITNLIAESGSSALLVKLRTLEEEHTSTAELAAKFSRHTAELVTTDRVASLFEKGRELFESRSLPSLKTLVKLFVDKVVVYPDNIYVLFNFNDTKKYPSVFHLLMNSMEH